MVEFKNVTKKYGDKTVLQNVSLKLQRNAPTVIMGESGKGKTTLMRIAAGLEKADGGEFLTDGEGIAFMFQEPRLLPWKTALENIRLILQGSDTQLAEKYFSAVGLDISTDGGKYPRELSGGMRQRVAFARFLAYAEASKATLLLLDEPFSALDEETAKDMACLLKGFAKDKTLLVVSHDKSDADTLEATIVRI